MSNPNTDINKIHLQWFAKDKDNDEITIEQIRAFIDANKERADVVEYISSISIEKPLNIETVSAYLGTVEGKNLVQPMIDRANTQAIKTHDEKQKPILEATVKAKVNEEIQRMNPSETPEQRQIREMRQEQEAMKATMAKERLDYAITSEFAKRNIPLELAKDIPYPSVEHAINAALIWDKIVGAEKEKAINEFVSKNAFKPGSGKPEENQGDPTKGMNSQEKFEYYKRQAEERDHLY